MSASATINTSLNSGWQLLTMASTNLSGIAGLSYSGTDFSFPSGSYIITVNMSNSTSAYLFGFQSSASASQPSSLTTPNLDTFCYVRTANTNVSKIFTHLYRFTATTPVRIYYNSSASATLAMGDVSIVKLS